MLNMTGMNVLLEEVKDEVKEEKLASGLFVPGTVSKANDFVKSKVLAVGPGEFQVGIFVEPKVKVGDVVFVDRQFLKKLPLGGKELSVTLFRDIVGVESV